MPYRQKIEHMISFINQHLDDSLNLEQLSLEAGFSKYHFHRLFTAYTGLSLHQYIRWLRLKRSANQLIESYERPIIDIALSAGFDSQAAFTRAFKQIIGLSPDQFRKQQQLVEQQSIYLLPKFKASFMDIQIRYERARRLATIEHRGHPEKVPESVMKLINWAKKQNMNLKPKPGESFGIAYDDPDTTLPEKFRFDLALAIPENLAIEKDIDIIEKKLPEGRYATFMHKGPRNKIGAKIYAFFRDWLPNSGEQLGELPCIFCYYNLDTEVAEDELLTECWFYLAN